MKKQLLLTICLLSALAASAQPFLIDNNNPAQNFTELQSRFENWKSGRDLKNEKGWKRFKRWEHDIMMHSDGSGNPANIETYCKAVEEAISMQNQNARSQMNVNWLPFGPYDIPVNSTFYMENGIGRVNCMAFHPNTPNTFYVGVAQGGLWKTTNGGQSYTPLTDQLPITRISDICIDPNNPNTLYISLCDFEYIGVSLELDARKRNTHYGLGVYKSTDGGITWNPTALTFQLTQGDQTLIRKIIVNPQNSQQILACGVSGMYKSNNGGTSFSLINDSLYWDMEQDPQNPLTIYAASGWVAPANAGFAALYKSTDFGNTWNILNSGIPGTGAVQRIELAIAPSNNNRIYALAVDINEGLYGFYRSNNGGNSWTQTSSSPNILEWNEGLSTGGQGTYDLGLAVSPSNPDFIITGGVNMWGSSDGGLTFQPGSHWTTQYGPSIHADIHQIKFQPLTGQLFVAHDGGISKTPDFILHDWTSGNWPTIWDHTISNGMNVTSFYRLSSSRNTDNIVIAGAQDNGSFLFNGSNWQTVIGGDGMDNDIDPNNPDYITGSAQFGYFAQSNDGGISFYNIDPGLGASGEWTTPIVRGTTPDVLLSGFIDVTKSTDNGFSWSTLGTMPGTFSSQEICALAVSPGETTIYAAKRIRFELNKPSAIFRSTNSGNTWQNITSGLPDSLYPTTITMNPNNPQQVFVAFAGMVSGTKIYYSPNGGNTWNNVSYNLPNLPVNVIKMVPGTTTLLAGLDVGVYQLTAGATAWVPVSNGLPNVIVSDIEINPAANLIMVSTFGRGIWQADLSSITGTNTLNNSPEWNISPNPSDGRFSINNTNQQPLRIDIYDIHGKICLGLNIPPGKTEINTELPSGLYFAKSEQGNIFKFIINKLR